jgi:23S rRNA (cytosine1962-C5)-methyltransferase
MSNPSLPVLMLNRNEERRLLAGHLWVFSNEIDTRRSALKTLAPGQLVTLHSAAGKVLGTAYVNPNTLICARLVSRRGDAQFDGALLRRRLLSALELRERLFAQPYYRLVYGESDGLPGLVIDRYGDVLVVQVTTAGMEQVRDTLLEVLQDCLQPAGILLRDDSPMRVLEGLPQGSVTIGAVPEFAILEEGGVRFRVPLGGGQKTGWFYDQRSNRQALHKYVPGRRVLDVFSYVGAWGLQAARAGASAVTCVDASAAALEVLQQSAQDNGLTGVDVAGGDAFEVLQQLRGERRRFDVVIVDPPAFIKRRKDIRQGEQGYTRLNQLALELLEPGGILVSCSCSMHLAEARLQQILLQAAGRQSRQLQLLERGFQCFDHPVHPAIAETAYLKALFCRVPE